MTLKRLRLPGGVSSAVDTQKREAEIKQYCENVMNIRRGTQRKDLIGQARNMQTL